MCKTHTQGDKPVLSLYSFNFEVEYTINITLRILPSLYIVLGCRQGREISVDIVTKLQAGRPICGGGNRLVFSKASNRHRDQHRLLFNRQRGVTSLEIT